MPRTRISAAQRFAAFCMANTERSTNRNTKGPFTTCVSALSRIPRVRVQPTRSRQIPIGERRKPAKASHAARDALIWPATTAHLSKNLSSLPRWQQYLKPGLAASRLTLPFGIKLCFRAYSLSSLTDWKMLYLRSCAATSGNTCVPSTFTASNLFGSSPSACRIVGATCAVRVVIETVCAAKCG